MYQFYVRLVRHGETDANVRSQLEAHTPTPLTARGQRQARALAAVLGAEGATFRRVYSSDTPRARQTAQLALPSWQPQLDERLREREAGQLHGLSYTEATRRHAEARRTGVPIAGLEPTDAVERRAWQFFTELSEQMKATGGGEAAVFTHAGWIHTLLRILQQRCGLRLAEQLPAGAPLHMCHNTGETRLGVTASGEVTCLHLYRDTHLTGDLEPTHILQADGTLRPRDSEPTSMPATLMD